MYDIVIRGWHEQICFVVGENYTETEREIDEARGGNRPDQIKDRVSSPASLRRERRGVPRFYREGASRL